MRSLSKSMVAGVSLLLYYVAFVGVEYRGMIQRREVNWEGVFKKGMWDFYATSCCINGIYL